MVVMKVSLAGWVVVLSVVVRCGAVIKKHRGIYDAQQIIQNTCPKTTTY